MSGLAFVGGLEDSAVTHLAYLTSQSVRNLRQCTGYGPQGGKEAEISRMLQHREEYYTPLISQHTARNITHRWAQAHSSRLSAVGNILNILVRFRVDSVCTWHSSCRTGQKYPALGGRPEIPEKRWKANWFAGDLSEKRLKRTYS